jgi:hypothetical protein
MRETLTLHVGLAGAHHQCSTRAGCLESEEGLSMDKQEAERLVRAIERTRVAWLQVDQIVFNEASNAYELKCSYRGPGAWLGAGAVWRTRWITSPREWITLLTSQRDTL